MKNILFVILVNGISRKDERDISQILTWKHIRSLLPLFWKNEKCNHYNSLMNFRM